LYVSKASACWDGFSEQQHGKLPEEASSSYIQNMNHNCQIHDKRTAAMFLSSLFIYLPVSSEGTPKKKSRIQKIQ
jgi:hypothetical protein